MGSRDRPEQRAKKKPKAKSAPAEPVAAFGAAPERGADPQAAQGAPVVEEDTRRGLIGRRMPSRPSGRRSQRSIGA